MPAYVKVSGAWKQATTAPACYVKVSGAWKKCSQVYIKVNGAWKPCYSTVTAKTATGPKFGSTVTLTNVEVGSLITLTGKFESTFTGTHNSSIRPGIASFSASGASFQTSEHNGIYYGTYRIGRPQAYVSYGSFTLGEEPSMKVGPLTTNYKIVLKATSSTVKISVSKTGNLTNMIKGLTCSISYRGS